MCPEAKPPIVVSSCLRENSVEETSADSLSPARRNHVDVAEEQSARDHGACPVLIAQRLGACHPDQPRCIFCHDEPGARLAQRLLETRDACRLMRPHPATARKVRLREHSDRRLEIGIATSPNPN
jgi:hypothetical protein